MNFLLTHTEIEQGDCDVKQLGESTIDEGEIRFFKQARNRHDEQLTGLIVGETMVFFEDELH